MLAIRLQRVGRTGQAAYRIIIQEATRHPQSGKLVAFVGSYDPHTKKCELDKEKIEKYLGDGAQPTPRVVKLLKDAKIKLPAWVEPFKADQKGAIRFPDKLRKNRTEEKAEGSDKNEEKTQEAPAEPRLDSEAQLDADDQTAQASNGAGETPAETTPEAETPVEEPKTEEAPAEVQPE